MMMDGLFLTVISFVYVGLMGVQTRIIVLGNYRAAFLVSMGIGIMSYFVYSNAAHTDLWYFTVTSAFGGSLGLAGSVKYKDWIKTHILDKIGKNT